MKKSDFYYDLPEKLIARHPANSPKFARMLVCNRNTSEIEHKTITDFQTYFHSGDLLIRNNTRVLPARLFARRKTGAQVQILLCKQKTEVLWIVLTTKGGRLKTGERLEVPGLSEALEMIEYLGEGKWLVRLLGELAKANALQKYGFAPLPPYIGRKEEEAKVFREQDLLRYQTVYAKIPGAIAAPTAGLHFTPEIFEALEAQGVETKEITLHVGEGTFKPVMEEDVENHRMHFERYIIEEETASALRRARNRQGRIVAIGTTSSRTLETLARRFSGSCENLSACSGETDIFIRPPYEFKLTDALLTNFHLPESTLLMLVSALLGRERALEIYKIAVENNYRFFSYGDCMLIM